MGPVGTARRHDGNLDAAGLRRMTRGGVSALSDAEGLALFDTALRLDDALLVPVRLRPGAASGPVPPLLRGLVRGGPPGGRPPERARPVRCRCARSSRSWAHRSGWNGSWTWFRGEGGHVLGYTDAVRSTRSVPSRNSGSTR
nr:hypothetical protein [Streptomyces clavuligerus]